MTLQEPQAELVDQAARLSVLSNISWAELVSSEGLTKDDKTIPIIDVFLRTAKQQRDVLALLGIERRAKNVTLSDYLESKVPSDSA